MAYDQVRTEASNTSSSSARHTSPRPPTPTSHNPAHNASPQGGITSTNSNRDSSRRLPQVPRHRSPGLEHGSAATTGTATFTRANSPSRLCAHHALKYPQSPTLSSPSLRRASTSPNAVPLQSQALALLGMSHTPGTGSTHGSASLPPPIASTSASNSTGNYHSQAGGGSTAASAAMTTTLGGHSRSHSRPLPSSPTEQPNYEMRHAAGPFSHPHFSTGPTAATFPPISQPMPMRSSAGMLPARFQARYGTGGYPFNPHQARFTRSPPLALPYSRVGQEGGSPTAHMDGSGSDSSRSGSAIPPPDPPTVHTPSPPPDPPGYTRGERGVGGVSSGGIGGESAYDGVAGVSGLSSPAPKKERKGYESFLNQPPPAGSYIAVETLDAEYKLIVRLPGFESSGITLSIRRRRILHVVADSWKLGGGHFERRISFGYDADLANVRAQFDGELLKIVVPRNQPSQDVIDISPVN